MTITTKMTKRDKRLLVLLSVFLIVVGAVWLVIVPAINDLNDLQTSINEQEIIKRGYDYKISGIPDAQNALIALETELLEQDEYYNVLAEFEIDRLLTGAALNFGFEQTQLRELTITPADKEATVNGYLSSEKTALTGIYEAKASMKLYAERQMLQAFLDSLANDYPSIRIASFSWSKASEDGYYELTVNLLIYMTNNAEYINAAETTDG